jgi:hypothetical protein
VRRFSGPATLTRRSVERHPQIATSDREVNRPGDGQQATRHPIICRRSDLTTASEFHPRYTPPARRVLDTRSRSSKIGVHQQPMIQLSLRQQPLTMLIDRRCAAIQVHLPLHGHRYSLRT